MGQGLKGEGISNDTGCSKWNKRNFVRIHYLFEYTYKAGVMGQSLGLLLQHVAK
jgi:hypothetical protein